MNVPTSQSRTRVVTKAVDLGGRTPPHALADEAAVLSAILSDGRKLDRVADILTPERFYSDANRRVFTAACELRAKGQPVDVQTVMSWLYDRDWLAGIGGGSYLTTLIDATPAIAHVEAYAKQVRDKARVRALIDSCQLIAARGFGDYGEAEEYLEEAEREIFELTRRPDEGQVFELRDLVAAEEARLDAIARGDFKPVGLPYGFRALDELTGGMSPGEITIVAGRPGMGKTSFATDIAYHVAKSDFDGVQHGVFFASIEMPRAALTRKMASQRSWTPVKRIKAGNLTDGEREKVRAAHAEIERFHITVDDAAGMSPSRLRARLRRAQAAFDRLGKRRMSLFVVDYVQRMKPDGTHATREREVGSCMTALAEIAKETSMHGVVCAQLNRLLEQRGGTKPKDIRPRMSDLRDSGQLEQDAHNIFFVHRPEYYRPKDEVPPEEKGLAEVIVAKQREGETGDVPLKFHGFCTRFGDV